MKALGQISPRMRFFMALGAALFLALVSGIASLSDRGTSGYETGGAFSIYAASEIDAAKLIRIEITEGSYSLKRTDAGWVMPEAGNAKVSAAKVNTLLNTLSSIQTVSRRTALAARLDTLGLGDPGAGGFGATLSLDSADAVMVFGVKNGRQYVRRAGEPQSWIADELLPPLHGARYWLDLPDLESVLRLADISSIRVLGDDDDMPEEDQAFLISVLKDIEIADVRARSANAVSTAFALSYGNDGEARLILNQESGGDWVSIAGMDEVAGTEFRIDALSASDLASFFED